MKVKLSRCPICDTWLHYSRNHCHVCGTTRAIDRKHYDYAAMTQGKILQVTRSIPSDLALRNSLSRGEA